MVAIDHVFGRLLRRSLFGVAITAFSAVAIYQGTVAGALALQVHYSETIAHLIVAAAYTALTLTGFVILWATGTKSASAPTLRVPREL